MDALEAQKMVSDAVAARGYMDGWSNEQFIARQLTKLIEETAEAEDWVHGIEPWFHADLATVGRRARSAFDDVSAWDWVEIDDSEREYLCKEVADIQVVLFSLADALGMDVVTAAVAKSAEDVERGVRK